MINILFTVSSPPFHSRYKLCTCTTSTHKGKSFDFLAQNLSIFPQASEAPACVRTRKRWRLRWRWRQEDNKNKENDAEEKKLMYCNKNMEKERSKGGRKKVLRHTRKTT
jgi:hypothetical protein